MEKKTKIIKSAFWTTSFVLIVKILGLLKQIILASAVGANMETDAFFLAGNTMNHLAELAFSAISISVLSMYTERLLNSGKQSANELISSILKVLFPAAVVLSVLFCLFSLQVSSFLAPGYAGPQLDVLADYIRILSPMIFLVLYSKTLNVVLETNQMFVPGKGRAFFQNLFVIAAALLLYPKFGMHALVYSFLAAAIVQAVQITFFSLKWYHFRIKDSLDWTGLKQLLYLSLPLLCGNAIVEINDIVDKQIASSLGEGTISMLTYGASINEIVTSLVVSSVSVVLFSQFAKWAAKGEKDKISSNLSVTIPAIALLIGPILVMCLVSPDLIVSALYGRGKFDQEAIYIVGTVAMAYSVGFLFQAAQTILVKVFYAFQKTTIPMQAGLLSISINIPLSFLFAWWIGPCGIALATSVAAGAAAVYLCFRLRKLLPSFSLLKMMPELGRILLACLGSGLILWFLKNSVNLAGMSGALIAGFAVLISYLIFAWLLKVSVMQVFADKALANFRKK